jgi:hypothetical protein
MMMLKVVKVEVDGLGEIEVREILYSVAEPLFDLPAAQMGKALIKASLHYPDGRLVFDGDVGLSVANACFKLVDAVLEVNGMGKTTPR